MWKLFKRHAQQRKRGKFPKAVEHILRQSRFMFALLKFLRQTRHMRRRARKRGRGKKKASSKKKAKGASSSKRRAKDGPLELKIHLTDGMLETEVKP